MEQLSLVIPSIKYKDKAIEYIKEHYQYNSHINGCGGLDRYIDNYDEWLKKIYDETIIEPTEKLVPAETYFLIRHSDDKIIGMTNIRLCLNDNLEKCGGHIGY